MTTPVGEGMIGIAAESGKRFGAEKGAGGSGAEEGGMTDLYKVNQIWYRMLPSLSLVAKRTYLINQAQQASYTGRSQTIIINFNTGEYYISPTTSYLYFKCGFYDPARYGGAKAIISQGNAMSLFSEVAFTTASGTEVDRQIDKGLHDATMYRWTHNQEYIDTIGQVQGAATGSYSANYDGVAPIFNSMGNNTVGTSPEAMFPVLGGREGLQKPRTGPAAKAFFGYGATNLNIHSVGAPLDGSVPTFNDGVLQLQEFCIPLSQVLGVFKPYLNTLFPAGALSGGRLELRIADLIEALQFIDAATETKVEDTKEATGSTFLANLIGDANARFRIENIYLNLDAYQLQDNVLKRLNQLSAGQDGLTYLYDTYDSTKTTQVGAGPIEVQVQQARSRIIRSICVPRPSNAAQNPYINSYAAEAAVERVCGMVGPGERTITANIPAVNTSGTIAATPGGGVTLVAEMKGPAEQKDVATLLGTGAVLTPMQWQARLPNDPYATGPTASPSWGRAIVSSYQAQLGALFFPQQPVTNASEHYMNACFVMCKGIPDKEVNSAVSFEDFKGGTGNNLVGTGLVVGTGGNYTPRDQPVNPSAISSVATWVAPYGQAIYGFLAEKSQLLNLSGLPISNARLLRHRLTFATAASGGQRLIHCFTEFTRVMKVFLGGRVVVRE